MSSTPMARMPSIGSVAHVTSRTGFLKRYEEQQVESERRMQVSELEIRDEDDRAMKSRGHVTFSAASPHTLTVEALWDVRRLHSSSWHCWLSSLRSASEGGSSGAASRRFSRSPRPQSSPPRLTHPIPPPRAGRRA